MLPILQFIVKNGLAAATKKFGTVAVKQAIKKTSKGKPKKAPSKPSPKRSGINPLTGKSQPPKAKAKGSTSKPKTKPKAPKKPEKGTADRFNRPKDTLKPNKPKSKPKSGKPKGTKSTKDFLGEMFGRKRTGKTPKRSDSQAYRDGVKAGQRKADEKLNPSLRNKEMAPRSIENRRLDVLRQIREAKASGSSPKMIEKLQARAQNLKNMKSDRPDLTTMRGKFKDGGLSVKNKKSRSDDTLEFFELLKRNKLTSKSKKPKIKKMPFKIKPGAKKPKLKRGPFKIDGKNKKFIKKLLGN